MKHRVSISERIISLTVSSVLVLGLALTIALGAASPAVGQGCEPLSHVPPPAPLGDPVWTLCWSCQAAMRDVLPLW